jgi:ACR3 family arsenite transporter
MLSLVQNWLIAPCLMFVLAIIFLHSYPEYMTGLILIGLARCIAMVLVWNGLACGDNQYVAALVAFNSIFQILFFSTYAWLFLTYLPPFFGVEAHVVNVSFGQLPMLFLSIWVFLSYSAFNSIYFGETKGLDWYQTKFLPKISPISLIALIYDCSDV